MDKFIKLRDKVIDILYWAKEQGHILDKHLEVLLPTIQEAAEEIEKE